MGLVNFLIKMGLDTTEVNIGVKRVESAFQGLGGNIGKHLGPYLGVGAFVGFIKGAVDAADAIGDLAEQTGETNENIQKLQSLANRSGVDVEKYLMAIAKMGEARNASLAGDQKKTMVLSNLGVSLDDSKSKQTNLELLIKSGVEFNKNKDSIAAQADATDLLGARMIKVLNTISGIKNLGPISMVSNETIKNAGSFSDDLGEIWRITKGITAEAFNANLLFAKSLIPSVGDIGKPLAFNVLKNLEKVRSEYQATRRNAAKEAAEKEAAATEDRLSAEQELSKAKKWEESMKTLVKDNADYQDNVKKKKDLNREMDQALVGSGFGVDSAVTRGAFFGGSDRQAQLGQGMNALKFRIEKLTEQIAEVNQKLEGN